MWPNTREAADFVTFTEEILNGELHFLCSDAHTNDILIFSLLLGIMKLLKKFNAEKLQIL